MHRRSWLTMDTIGENTVKSTSKEASFHGAIINARILTVRLKRFSKGHTKGRSLRLYTRGHMTILNLSLVAGTQAVLLCLHRKKDWIRILLLMAEMVNYSSVCTIFFQNIHFVPSAIQRKDLAYTTCLLLWSKLEMMMVETLECQIRTTMTWTRMIHSQNEGIRG